MPDFHLGQMVHFNGPTPYSITSEENEFVGFTVTHKEEGCVWVGVLTSQHDQDLSILHLIDAHSHSSFIHQLRDELASEHPFCSIFRNLSSQTVSFHLDKHYKIIFFCVRTEHMVAFDPSSEYGTNLFKTYPHIQSSIYQDLLLFDKRMKFILAPGVPLTPSFFL